MNEKITQELFQIVAGVFNVKARRLSLATVAEDIPSWDSMNILVLVVALEEHFKVNIAPEEALQMKSMAAILQLLESKGVQ